MTVVLGAASGTTQPKKPRLITPKARLSFPTLFRPKAIEQGKEPVYSCTLLFSPEAQATPEFAALKKAAHDCVMEKWNGKPPAGLRSPFRKAEEKEGREGYEPGWIFINVSSKQRPGVVDRNRQQIIDENDIYPGCWVIASLNPYAYDQKGNKGVSFGLNNVMKVADGTALGSRVRAEDDFANVEVPPEGGASGGTTSPGDLF
jgi:hypothetical protein